LDGGNAISASVSGGCPAVATHTFQQVAEHFYEEIQSGPVVEVAIRRLERSPALIAAVQAGDRRAARSILRGLLADQLVRVWLLRNGRLWLQIGKSPALAPVSGALQNAAGQTIGKLLVASQSIRTYANSIAQLTGAQVVLFEGQRELRSTDPSLKVTAQSLHAGSVFFAHGLKYRIVSFAGHSFPDARIQVALLLGSSLIACGETPAQTNANAIGEVAQRIYRGESAGRKVRVILREMERSSRFLRAVASRDPVATRGAIVGFFRSHAHIVRVRVTVGSRLLVDVGGPYVLAPIRGKLSRAGTVIGRFVTSIQDDAGYLKLVHLFTGAQVLIRSGGRQLMATLPPDSAELRLPDRGTVTYHGAGYQVYSFAVQAFPSGPLRISLLLAGA
jgi:hypothetical protein